MKNYIKLFSLHNLLLWLRSYQAALLGLIIFTTGVVFQSEQFFIDAYPENMPSEQRVLASFFIAISLEFLIILITVNYQHDNDFAINTIFLVYLVITSYFLDTYLPGKSIGYYLIRSFTSLLIAFMARTYADLLVQKLKEFFTKKYKSNPIEHNLKEKLIHLQSLNQNLKSSLEKKNKAYEELINKRKKIIPNQIPINYGKN